MTEENPPFAPVCAPGRAAARDHAAIAYRGAMRPETRALPVETPIALSYQGSTHAVMLATPADLTDFALGFSLSEGVVREAAEIARLDVRDHPNGLSLEMWLTGRAAEAYAVRRRLMIGPTGCGLCGIESLDAFSASSPIVASKARFTPAAIAAAMRALDRGQTLHARTHAVHGAALVGPAGSNLVREDVGRHNALDKLAGAAARAGLDADRAILALSSRVSVEMVRKAARLGAPVIAAVSAPTDLALREAEAAGLTLVAIARGAQFEVFTHADRIDASECS